MKVFLTGLNLLLVAIVLSSCQQKMGNHHLTSRGLASLNGKLEFTSNADFQNFPKVMGYTLVKFVATLNNQGQMEQVEFIDPRVFEFHHQYMSQMPEFKGWGYPQFKEITFFKQNRRFIFGALSVNKMDFGEGQWQAWVRVNTSTQEAIDADLFQKIASHSKSWWADNAEKKKAGEDEEDYDTLFPMELSSREYVLQISPHQFESAQAKLKEYNSKKIEVRFDQNKNTSRIYTAGWGMGKALIVQSEAQLQTMIAANQVTNQSILILKEAVNELPPVAGIISAVPLTEASHMVLLAQMYGIPLVYEKDAPAKRNGAQGKVSLLYSQLGDEENFSFIEELTSLEIDELKKLQRHRKLGISVNWEVSKIEEVSLIDSQQVKSYGGKAVNFGLLRRHISGNTGARAYGIPLKFFKQFVDSAVVGEKKVSQLIQETLTSLGANPTYSDVNAKTQFIRESFAKAQISADFFENIRKELVKLYPGQGVRLKLRSSSNVEDGAEFNAAGLYESEGVCLSGCPKNDFAEGLRKVWGSLYTTRGFWARKQFQVNESDVGMGILVHQPYSGEVSNGVAKLKWKRDEEGKGYLEVFGVLGEEESVANPNEKGSNELASFDNGRLVNHRPLRGLAVGRLMMNQAHYQKLNDLMVTLAKKWPRQTNELEIESEWKEIKTEQGGSVVHIKQVREIPRPQLGVWPKGKTKYFIGQNTTMTSSLPEDGGAMALFTRFHTVGLAIDPFTEEEFIAKKLKVGQLQLKGSVGNFSLPFKEMGLVRKWNGGASVDIKYLHPRFKEVGLTLTVSLGPDSVPVRTIFQSYPTMSIQWKRNSEKLRYGLHSKVHENDFLVAEKRPLTCQKEEGENKCPIRIQSCSSAQRWLLSDSEFRNLDALKIVGLGAKTVEFGPNSVFYFLQQHEGLEGYFFDLSKALNITEAERNNLIKSKGHYLYRSAYGGVQFLNENFEEKLEVKECGVGQYDDEEEAG